MLLALPAQAQQVDRSQPPEPGPAPKINIGEYQHVHPRQRIESYPSRKS